MKTKCPLCGSDRCAVVGGEGFVSVSCEAFKVSVSIQDSAVSAPPGDFCRMMNLVTERAVSRAQAPGGECWRFYWDADERSVPQDPACLNLSRLLCDYPRGIMDKTNRILLNLTNRHSSYGAVFPVSDTEQRLYLLHLSGRHQSYV